MDQISLFVCASVHLGDLDFSSSIDSRGKQWALMSLSALICEQLLLIQLWNSKVLDAVLLQGDAMYRSAIQEHKNFDLPNIASLLVGINSRIVVGFSENPDQGHELNVSTLPMAVNENDDSSVVTNECVLPVEVDLEPVLAKNCTRSNQT